MQPHWGLLHGLALPWRWLPQGLPWRLLHGFALHPRGLMLCLALPLTLWPWGLLLGQPLP